MPETKQTDPNLPEGWYRLEGYSDEAQGIRAYQKDDRILICGTPADSEDEENSHNCDQMGCGWDHVLGRFTLTISTRTTDVVSRALTPEQHEQ